MFPHLTSHKYNNLMGICKVTIAKLKRLKRLSVVLKIPCHFYYSIRTTYVIVTIARSTFFALRNVRPRFFAENRREILFRSSLYTRSEGIS